MTEPKMTVASSRRSFELRISGQVIASISTKVFEQEQAAAVLCNRYNTQPELLAAAKALLSEVEKDGLFFDQAIAPKYRKAREKLIADMQKAIAKSGER